MNLLLGYPQLQHLKLSTLQSKMPPTAAMAVCAMVSLQLHVPACALVSLSQVCS